MMSVGARTIGAEYRAALNVIILLHQGRGRDGRKS